MSKLTFTEAGKAKLTWNVSSSEGNIPTSELDSLNVVINGTSKSIPTSSSSYEFDVNETTEVYMEAAYNDITVKTKAMTVEIIKEEEPDTPVTPPVATTYDVYYGSPSIGEGLEWDEGGEAETLAWIETLPTIIDSLVDSNPISVNSLKVANPGKLVKLTKKTSATGTYNFYNMDDVIEYAQPMLLYPVSFGEMKKITDSMGSTMSINSNDKYGFYKTTVKIGDVDYYLYIIKGPDSTDTTGDPIPLKFSKS
mgnify:CR=1 FL=1